jgi:large repetitive protein
MASFNDNRRGQGPKRRLDDPRRRRQSILAMEPLENRRLLTGGSPWVPTSTNLLDAQNGPMANLGTDTVKAYGEYLTYVAAGAKGTFTLNLSEPVWQVGTYIGMDLQGSGNFTTYEAALKSIGMVVTATDPTRDMVEGFVQLKDLPQVAEEAQTVGGQPNYKPVQAQEGVSPNQADTALNVAAARNKFSVNGAGQTIGVLSDSVNEFQDSTAAGAPNNLIGLAASVASGDLPAGNLTGGSNVNVIQDLPVDPNNPPGTDEGRAMLEQIYDLAPAAQLAFATGATGEVGMATNINALFNAGAGTIVDDELYFEDPFYQDGVIQQAADNVVSKGATYLSSAGNSADSGYESQFRPVQATVGSLGSGTYMNFDPTGNTQTTEIGINVYDAGTGLVMQFDQPFYTTNGVVSNVEIDVLDQAGNVVAQGNQNNVAVQQPVQITAGLPVGQYNVVIKVDSGPAPNHVVFYATGDGGFSVDTKFGSAGGTYYPSTHGHNAGAETISTGAVPFWATPNIPHTPTLDVNEPYSSFGPVLTVFNPDGTPLPVPQLLLKPDVSATDANNTSFFGPGQILDTTQPLFPANPPFPGDPVTSFPNPTTATNQLEDFPNFTGTSSAAPNLAAIVALMKESNPTLTRNEIVTNLITTTSSLDGIPAGTWSPQAGYGLVNALAALSAVQTLQVTSIVPGGNSTVTTVPKFITVTFNQSININTISAANLLVIGANGASVTVGAPIGVDSPTTPSVVEFPISIVAAPGQSGNGVYKDAIIGPGITAVSGEKLSASVADQFNIEDVNGPRVLLTTYFGRIVTIQFNQALNPNTVNQSNIFVFRTNGGPNIGTMVSDLPGAKFTYNPVNFTVTIDLTGVAQSSLPTDHYGLVVQNTVTDVLNNPLNGAFNNVFPSGTTPEAAGGSTFFQDLGVVNLQAPIISAIGLAANSDSGIAGDNNTNDTTPSVTGQVTAKFPGTVSGLLVFAEFNGISHPGVLPGGLDLGLGTGGRGFVGHFDVQTTTNALGQFTINYPAGVTPLPDGLNTVRVVVVGAADIPPLPGLSSVLNTTFRIDTTVPFIGAPPSGGLATSIVNGEDINSLSALTLNFVDPVNPQGIGSPFAVPATFNVPALNPTTADNLGSYGLFLVNGAGTILADESKFITSATFASTSARVLTSDPYTGAVNLTFAPGLPAGSYEFLVKSSVYGTGLSDAAGNPFYGGTFGTANYLLSFTLQPTPTYITSYVAYTPNPSTPGGLDTSGPRANYELPVSGVAPRADAPPTLFTLDFSNSLDANLNYSNDVELVGSGMNSAGLPTGNFGDLGITNTNGFTPITGLNVVLTNSVIGAVKGQYGFDNRLLISLPAGFTLPANYYRVYLPNTGTQAILDVFGNQLDGEFDGYQNATGKYVDQIQDGTVRGAGVTDPPDLSGDGNPGGAFMTGFVVVPNGNIIFANADAIYNPLIPSETPNGSAARPYPVLAPEAVPNAINGGDLNSPVNAGTNFDPTYDRSGDGQFEPSAFFAAQQALNANGGPVVVIAEASVPSYDSSTNSIIQKPYVLQAPSPTGNNVATIANDGSTAIPAMTTLVFQAGSILKMQNAALIVQNQGSALQVDGGPNSFQTVVVTSYKDSSVGGVTNGDPNSTPTPGDFGGIVFRNFSQAAIPGDTAPRNDLFTGQIPITGNSTEDDRLKGQFTDLSNPASQADAVSGADDIMSSISFLTERFAGGTVPVTIGTQYDGITLLNSRPSIVNSTLADSAVAGISADVDSLRDDDVAQGPLIRNDQFVSNGLNGIYIRANTGTGIAEPTDAVGYPTNPTDLGGAANYSFNNPYPYLLTSKMEVGQQLQVENGASLNNTDRLYIVPGMVVKFESGAWIEVGQDDGFGLEAGTAAGLVVGDPTYIHEFDVNNQINPSTPGFVANSANLPNVVFTSFNDNAAMTASRNPFTGVMTTIVAPLPTLPASAQTPPPTKANWGGIQLDAGSVDTINSAIFEFGGGFVNTVNGFGTEHALEINKSDAPGAFIEVTNNIFLDNADVPINTTPNVWLATNQAEPLLSGAPFIHGNMFVGNDFNGVGVLGGTEFPNTHANGSPFNFANVDENSLWSGGDFTYFVRQTIILGPNGGSAPGDGVIPLTPSGTTLQPTPTPNVTLTLQSTLPGTVLADGSVVPAPGVPLVIKLLTSNPSGPVGSPGAPVSPETVGTIPTPAISNSYEQGAGFVVGIDNGIDPNADSLVDPGAFSEIRITGIGANQATGQARVPVIITSAFNDTVGTTVNGVTMDQLVPGNTRKPAPGDGGVIYFGANSLTSYNLTDPRSGSIIDNADISDITRVEQQGGGLTYGFAIGGTAFTPNDNTLFGLPQGGAINNSDQFNSPKSLTVSNSNFNSFSSAGFVAQPGNGSLVIAVNFVNTPTIFRNTTLIGEPTHDYFVNDTFSNMPVGISILSVTGIDEGLPGTNHPAPAMAVILNTDFYNDVVGVLANGKGSGPGNASVSLLVMDSIFDSTIPNSSGVVMIGDVFGGDQNNNLNHTQTILPGQLVYDDFFGLTTNYSLDGVVNAPLVLSGAQFVDPQFRNAAAGNFFLLPTSGVIDVARSEIGPSPFGDMLYPQVNYPVDPVTGAPNLSGIPIRNEPTINTLGELDQTLPAGDINIDGATGFDNDISGPNGAPYFADIVTLPGRVFNGKVAGTASVVNYPDQWIAVLQSSGLGTVGNAASPSSFAYEPVTGQRDQVGDQRTPDPNSPNKGFGTEPFFDLGAFEFIVQNPPVVEGVGATTSSGLSNLYSVGGIAGVNKLPSTITFLFNEQLNQASLNGMSVILEESTDGTFSGANLKTISLSGLLSFDKNDDILTINTSSIFTSLVSDSAEYRIILKGTGSAVIRDNSGLALDGLNLDANGNQLPLPSGADNFPGSDFQVTFTIDTHPPAIVPGTFQLDPASDSSGGLNITNIPLPTFDGTITDSFPPTNFLQGQTVEIDVSSQGNGVFDILNAGTGVTNAQGQFKITLTKPIPKTPNIVGTNGLQEGPGSSLTYVRVRIIDQSGNASNLPTDPISAYGNEGALTGLQEDPVSPVVTAFSPTANTVVQPNANGQVVFTTTFSKNMKNPTINASSVLVFRTGGTGNFTNPVAVPLIPGSFTVSYSTAPATLGFETVTYAVAGSQPNDQYEVVLKGTGATPITDLAGNKLDNGTDFTSGPVVLFSPSNAHLIYVGTAADVTGIGTGVLGTRENPFPTIAAAMTAALIGDDVLVLPGTYEENVTVKTGVRLLSAGLGSTDTSFTSGSPYQTLIYGQPTLGTKGGNITTVLLTGSLIGIPTEISGFAIISPLVGDSNLGQIDPSDTALRTVNSNAVIDRNIIVNAGIGMYLTTAGPNAPTSTVFDNLVVGNINGIEVSDLGATSSLQSPFMIVNNTIADNTTGLFNVSTRLGFGVTQSYVINNIFYANHSLTTQRTGTGIASGSPATLAVGNNLFFQNGATNAAASNATGQFLGFNPANLSSTPDGLGNLVGNPFFAQAEDPRPNGDTPAVFFTFSNFDLTSRSVAINAASGAFAPPSDFLYRTPVTIAGHGFPGTGPASIGAFYFGGTSGPSGGTGTIFTGTGTPTGTGTGTGTSTGSGVPGVVSAESAPSSGLVTGSSVGGGIALGTKQFNVVTTSLSNNGTEESAGSSGGLVTEPGPAFIDVDFSDDINATSLTAADLVLSGTGLSAGNPAHVSSLGWIDDHAVRFYLSGGYNNSGTLTFSIPQGSITDLAGAALAAFSDTVLIGTTSTPTQTPPATVLPPAAAPVSPMSPVAPVAPVAPTTLVASVLPVVQPVAAPAPFAVPLIKDGATKTTQKLTAKEQKAQKAAEAKAEKAQKAAEAKAEKAQKAAHAAQVKAQKAAAAKAAKAAKVAASKAKHSK